MIDRRRIHGSLNQSSAFPSSSTYCSAPSPTVSKVIPSQSTLPVRRRWPGGSLRKVVTRNVERIAIGTLMKKHQFQL